MENRFFELISSLEPKLHQMLEMDPVSPTSLPENMPRSGIYLFSQGARHLYIGRSRNIRGRIGRHCRPGATHRMAAFAFRLAREATGQTNASYAKKGSRSALMEDVIFREAFNSAKARIRNMHVRFVEQHEPIRQALLEIYAAVILETPYNDFDTH